LRTSNYKHYIANLRAAGCPELTIQDIIIAAVNRQYAAREAALNLRPELAKPWELAGWSGAGYYDKQRQMRELAREKRALLKDLLGIDVPVEIPAFYAGHITDKFETAFAALPETKRELVRYIQEEFWDKSDALDLRTRGFWEPQDLEERKLLRQQRKEALAKVLAPDELENYEMATSPTATTLRAQLTAFEPTDQELRGIFRLRQQLDEDLDTGPPGSSPEERMASFKRSQANREFDQQIKSLLGEQRYAEYQRSQDNTFRDLASIAQQDGLPQESAIKAYDAQKLARQEAVKVRSIPGLSPDQRQEALRAMQAELNQTLVQLLGEHGFQTFQRNNGGNLYSNRRRVSSPPPPQ
jgi:hypothetical protein